MRNRGDGPLWALSPRNRTGCVMAGWARRHGGALGTDFSGIHRGSPRLWCHERPQRPGQPLRLAADARHLGPRGQDRLRAQAVARRAARPTRPRRRLRRGGRRRGDRGLRAGDRPGGPRLHQRPRTHHPPRREGPDRGVQRPCRVRTHPQGHDLARPHREHRTAAGARLAAGGPDPRRRGAGAARPAGHRVRRSAADGPLPQRGRAADHPRQAVRDGGRRAAHGPRPPRRPHRPLPRSRDQGPRRHRPGHARPPRWRRRQAGRA